MAKEIKKTVVETAADAVENTETSTAALTAEENGKKKPIIKINLDKLMSDMEKAGEEFNIEFELGSPASQGLILTLSVKRHQINSDGTARVDLHKKLIEMGLTGPESDVAKLVKWALKLTPKDRQKQCYDDEGNEIEEKLTAFMERLAQTKTTRQRIVNNIIVLSNLLDQGTIKATMQSVRAFFKKNGGMTGVVAYGKANGLLVTQTQNHKPKAKSEETSTSETGEQPPQPPKSDVQGTDTAPTVTTQSSRRPAMTMSELDQVIEQHLARRRIQGLKDVTAPVELNEPLPDDDVGKKMLAVVDVASDGKTLTVVEVLNDEAVNELLKLENEIQDQLNIEMDQAIEAGEDYHDPADEPNADTAAAE